MSSPAASPLNSWIPLVRSTPLPRAAIYDVPSRNFILVISQGSIAKWSHNNNTQSSAIVNAADDNCLGGGGADGAISIAGGKALKKDRLELPELLPGVRCKTGSAVLTGPNSYGSLNVRYVIHAVGPNYNACRTKEEVAQGDELLSSAYTASLECGKSQNIEAIAFSLLSSGFFRGKRSLEEVLKIGIETICKFGGYPALQEVHLCAFNEKVARTLIRVATELGLEAPKNDNLKLSNKEMKKYLKKLDALGKDGVVTSEDRYRLRAEYAKKYGKRRESAPTPAPELRRPLRPPVDVINELRNKRLFGDHAIGKDLLGVLDEANAIADTIAFKDLQLPFVVGIIGGWGSGKSFTYNLIQDRLKEIQKYDLTDENVKQKFPFVGHIFLVKFDVWTFAKGNLWSSLMYRILTDLNDQLDLEETVTPAFIKRGVSVLELLDEFTTSGERKYLKKAVSEDAGVQEEIRKWNPSGGNITRALIDATNTKYGEDVKDLVEKKQELAWRCVTAESNAKILPEIKKLIKDTYKKYAEENPDDPVPQSVDAAMKGVKQWRGILGCLKRYWDLFQAGRLSPLWLTVILTSLILAVALPLVLKEKIGAIATAIGPVLSVVPVSGIFAKYHDAREKMKSAQEEIRKVASEMHLDKEVLREALRAANEAQLRRNTNDEEKQQGIIQKLNAEINSLEDRIWLREGDSLNKVVKDRVGSSNYEEHLGVVHQAQDDLKHISCAMLSNKKIFQRGDPRIVLFIDDLDRCPPKKVVETLEAVQLLVKTKLFVVVLAIDTQYVTLCLENEYKNILDPKRHPSGLDYIEKIIQLPYRVPPIGNEYMKPYLQEQMNAKKKETRGLFVGTNVEPLEAKSPRPKDDTLSLPPRQSYDNTPLLPDYINVDEATIDKEAPEPTKPAVAIPTEELESDKEAPTKPAVAIPTEELEFTWEELELLEDACVLSGVSPRSTRRLVNVFKLMKIIWYRRDQTPDVDTPFELRMKEACVLILALCASSSKRVRQGMCKVLAKVEQTRSMPVGCSNLKDFIKQTLGERGTGQVKDGLFTMIDDEKCSMILEKVVWGEDEEKWNQTRKDLRLLRSFSFVGEYSEPVDGNGIHHPSYTDTRN